MRGPPVHAALTLCRCFSAGAALLHPVQSLRAVPSVRERGGGGGRNMAQDGAPGGVPHAFVMRARRVGLSSLYWSGEAPWVLFCARPTVPHCACLISRCPVPVGFWQRFGLWPFGCAGRLLFRANGACGRFCCLELAVCSFLCLALLLKVDLSFCFVESLSQYLPRVSCRFPEGFHCGSGEGGGGGGGEAWQLGVRVAAGLGPSVR